MTCHSTNGACGCTSDATNASTATAIAPTSATAVPAVPATASSTTFRPTYDVLRDAEGLTLIADVPGAKPATITVTFEKDTLTVRAPVVPRARRSALLVEEYGVGDYLFSVRVGDDVEPAGIAAACSAGVLTIRLPKRAEFKPRRIDVTTGA